MSDIVEFVTVTVTDEETTVTVHQPEFFFKRLKLPRNSHGDHPFPLRVLLELRDKLLLADSMNKREFRRLLSLGIAEPIPLPEKLARTWDFPVNERFALDLTDYIRANLHARPVHPRLLWDNA